MRLSVQATSVLLSVVWVVACGSEQNGPAPAVPNDGGGSDEIVAVPSAPLGGEAGPPSDAAPARPQANLRIAHLSPELPPLDVCVAPHGTTNWSGPLLGQLSGEAGAPGVAYSQVSAYLSVAPGQYDLRIVPADSVSCCPISPDAGEGGPGDADAVAPADAPNVDASDTGVLDGSAPVDAGGPASVPDLTDLPPLAGDAYATVLIAGELAPSGSDKRLTTGLVFDDSQLAGGAAALRAINALPRGDALDFGLGSFATKWTALLVNVGFGAASSQAGPSNGSVDPKGYLPVPPLSGETMSARLSTGATGDTIVANSVTVPLGSIATVIAVGGSASDPAHPAALLLCIDNQPSGGTLSDCSLVQ